eukprot:TRINITY_DN1158_c4_g4_i1.p1 TRINITY_DN1158_c4_g4~~TRINITY_DN1158_c4_g4_i1.p1  ORF type:complete len:372 (+),score=152.22 TRINITY_DN1158_c4_g4_i1:881-1996(+)
MFSLYYIVSELWGSAGIPLLFWTCANEVTPIKQAKRFYTGFGLLGNLAPVASGLTMVRVAQKSKLLGLPKEVEFARNIRVLTLILLGAGGITVGLYEYVHKLYQRELAADPDSDHATLARVPKEKMGLGESFRFLSRSKYLGFIALMVMSYGICMEFTELMWKAIVRKAFSDKSEYMSFMGKYSQTVGYATTSVMLLGNQLVARFGWELGALMTPVMMLLLAIPFFGYVVFGNVEASRTALMRAVYIGAVQNILSKATKYALFDPTKEMAYIPLDQASKVKGKAAIDVLGARLGKSLGAFAQQAIVLVSGSVIGGAPFLAGGFTAMIGVWSSSVVRLGVEFRAKTEENERAAAARAAALAEEASKVPKRKR